MSSGNKNRRDEPVASGNLPSEPPVIQSRGEDAWRPANARRTAAAENVHDLRRAESDSSLISGAVGGPTGRSYRTLTGKAAWARFGVGWEDGVRGQRSMSGR